MRWISSLVFFVGATACQAQVLSNERAFAEEVLPRLQAAMPDAMFEIDAADPLQINIRDARNSDDSRINLHRIFNYCRTAPAEECEAERSSLVDNLTKPLAALEVEDLRVLVRDQQYWNYVAETFPSLGERPPHRKIGEDLYAILAFDGAQTIALATPKELAKLGLDAEAAWKRAHRQTAAILPPLPSGKEIAANGVAFEDFEYLASLLADTDAWTAISREAGPDLFVTAVSDYFVLTGVLPSGPSLEEFRKTVEEDCAAQPRCVSPNIYRFRDGQWVVAR